MKTCLFHGIVENSKTRVLCLFCGVYIPKANKCIEQHTNGAKHTQHVELMTDNGLYLKDDVLYCKPCERNLLEDESVLNHIYNNDHENWITAMEDLIEGEFINIEDFLSNKKKDLFCEACNCHIACILGNIQEHVNAFNHRNNVVAKLKPLNGLFNTENEEIWCKICDIYINNTVGEILDHLDHDAKHINWLSEIEEFEGYGISIEEYLMSEHQQNAVCKKCHTQIPCNYQSIEEHVFSDSHSNNVINQSIETS